MVVSKSSPQARIRCVVFDAVGTLIHAQPSVAKVYQSIAEAYGVSLPVSEVDRRFRAAMRSRPMSVRTSEEIERQFWQETVQTVIGPVRDSNACFQELHNHFGRADAWKLDSDAGTTLSILRNAGIGTAIASNFDDRLNRIVSEIPELRDCKPVIISSSVGWKKPHPEFFNSLLNKLAIPPAEVLMVGDDFQNDILPARAMGMQTLHLVPGLPTQNINETGTICALSELLKWNGIVNQKRI